LFSMALTFLSSLSFVFILCLLKTLSSSFTSPWSASWAVSGDSWCHLSSRHGDLTSSLAITTLFISNVFLSYRLYRFFTSIRDGFLIFDLCTISTYRLNCFATNK
jgi:hypothetical protein